ncbi:MAG: flagellar protein FlaG, partial [Deltaproteobacteria bacterium]|nr:flagellar protein FlaG [Deltaproteobacteria bacterium]
DHGEDQPKPSTEQVRQAMEGVNAFLKANGTHVQFAMHQETKRMMVEVMDDATGEVLRTIPSKELLDLSARIGEMVGVLLDKKG